MSHTDLISTFCTAWGEEIRVLHGEFQPSTIFLSPRTYPQIYNLSQGRLGNTGSLDSVDTGLVYGIMIRGRKGKPVSVVDLLKFDLGKPLKYESKRGSFPPFLPGNVSCASVKFKVLAYNPNLSISSRINHLKSKLFISLDISIFGAVDFSHVGRRKAKSEQCCIDRIQAIYMVLNHMFLREYPTKQDLMELNYLQITIAQSN